VSFSQSAAGLGDGRLTGGVIGLLKNIRGVGDLIGNVCPNYLLDINSI
jgi:hypothetical protein